MQLFATFVLLVVIWRNTMSLPLALSNISDPIEHEVVFQKNLLNCSKVNTDLVEEGSCTYPPPRSNRDRKTCHMSIELNSLHNYCYNSTEPHAIAAYCDREANCWCNFDSESPPKRSCYIYRQIEYDSLHVSTTFSTMPMS